VHVAMQLSINCPVTYLGMHVVPLSTIACHRIWSSNGVLDEVHRPDEVSPSILRRHSHRQQSHSLSLRQKEFALWLIWQAWTVITTTIALHYLHRYRYLCQMPSPRPPFHSSYQCKRHSCRCCELHSRRPGHHACHDCSP
jgi:hypothetical protein